MKHEILPLTTYKFFAALYVFIFHIQFYWPICSAGPLQQFVSLGSSGMSMFFVFSGFILTYHYKNDITDYADYAVSRLTRIYPSYVLAAVLALPWLISSLTPYQSGQGIRYVFILLTNMFMLQAWIPQMFAFWNDNGSWSLSVEIFFYALLPFLLRFFVRLTTKQLVISLGLLYVASVLPGISWILFEQYTTHLVYYCTPIYRLPEFMIGIICGLLYLRGIRFSYPARAIIFSSFCYYCCLAWGPTYGYTAMTHHYVTVPLVAVTISCMASLSSGWLYTILTNRVFVYLGRISYSFYSLQIPLLLLLLAKHAALINYMPMLVDNRIFAFSVFVFLVSSAAVNHYYIEVKLRAYLKRKYREKSITDSTVHDKNSFALHLQ